MFLKKSFTLVLVVLNIGLALHLVWGENGLLALRERRAIRDDLQARLMSIQEENLDLSRRIRLLKTDVHYQELIVRQELQFVESDEILYILKPR